jgi:hypothetical protein
MGKAPICRIWAMTLRGADWDDVASADSAIVDIDRVWKPTCRHITNHPAV